MYYPYLRGKMYELQAVRESIKSNLIDSKYVSPIIEPVKNTSTFNSLLKEAKAMDYKLNIIDNPQVGDYEDVSQLQALIKSNNMRNSIIISENGSNIINAGDLLFYEAPKRVLNIQTKDNTINVIPDNSGYRWKIGKPKNTVIFEDCFKKRDRNADYAKTPDEDFSIYHLMYQDDNYSGFGDYSVIGSDYLDSGFAPYAVAVHIVYFDEDDSLRVHHFVSNSNDDIRDPANKLHEALSKLDKWINSSTFDKNKNWSKGLKELDTLYTADRYTGLGYLKKLEIMHHLEIMNRYLKEN